MTRLDRLVLGRFLAILGGCLLAIAIVFVAVDYVGAIRIWNDRSSADIRSYYFHALPYILFLVSPIAVLLSSMFTIAGFARRLELMAMQSAGLPLWRILLPIWLAAIAYSGAWVWIGEHILPHANQERIRIRPPRTREAFDDSPYRVDFAFKAGPDASLFFRDYAGPSKSGSRVTFSRIDTGSKVFERLDAAQMTWDGKVWVLRTGSERIFDSTGRLKSFRRFDSTTLSLPQAKPEDLIATKTLPDEMSRTEILQRVQVMRRAGEPTLAWEAEAEFKRSSPWVGAIVSIIGTALAALVGRRGQAIAFGLGIMTAFSFYVAVRIGLALGHAGDLSPLWSAWYSHGVFLVLGLGLLWRASRT